mgnify:CR=1 FL=1
MKKKLLLSSCLILSGLLVYSAGVYSSNDIRAKLNSINIVINGTEQKENGPSFTYNNATYVRLRSLSQNLGARVSYDSELSTIYVDTLNNLSSKFSFHNSVKDGDSELSIHADKLQFEYGKPINLLSHLRYYGKSATNIVGSGVPFYFYDGL